MQLSFFPLASDGVYANMALDAFLLESQIPSLRFYRFAPDAVTFGFSQSPAHAFNLDHCQKKGIPFTRRLTGGGAVYHPSHGEITYSIALPTGKKTVIESYHEILQPFLFALRELGFQPTIASTNDLVIQGKKVSGSAQVRTNGFLLQHGTVLINLDRDRFADVLCVQSSKQKICYPLDRLACLNDFQAVSEKKVYTKLLDSFKQSSDLEKRTLSSEQKKEVAALEEKFASPKWIYS